MSLLPRPGSTGQTKPQDHLCLPDKSGKRTPEPITYEHALREFSQGITLLSETGKHDEVGELVERLIRAVETRGREKATIVRNWHNYLNTALGLITLAAVLIRGGAVLQQIQEHDAAIRTLQTQVQSAQQVSVQIATLQTEVAALQSSVQNEISRLRDRVDKVLDKR